MKSADVTHVAERFEIFRSWPVRRRKPISFPAHQRAHPESAVAGDALPEALRHV